MHLPIRKKKKKFKYHPEKSVNSTFICIHEIQMSLKDLSAGTNIYGICSLLDYEKCPHDLPN